MNIAWKYPILVPNTQQKDRLNEFRRHLKRAGYARAGGGMKIVETPSGTAHYGGGGGGTQRRSSSIPRWG